MNSERRRHLDPDNEPPDPILPTHSDVTSHTLGHDTDTVKTSNITADLSHGPEHDSNNNVSSQTPQDPREILFDLIFDTPINAVDCYHADHTPSTDVYDDEPSELISIDINEIRAQIDTGAHVSCTNLQHILHQYTAFNESFPCPIRMKGAITDTKAIPLGVGYLHVPAPTPQGFLPVLAFYNPALTSTLIDERAFIKAAGFHTDDYPTDNIAKNRDTGTFTYHANHRLRKSQDLLVHGVLIHGKCYTHGLIPPNLTSNHPAANPQNSSALAIKSDPDFARQCQQATLYHIFLWQENEYAKLRDQLHQVPPEFHDLPFHEYIHRNTPVNAIRATTERLLWHQRLGHPSDYYLYHAHKFIKGVPAFKHFDPILESCPTCIRAKQRKEPAGHNTTRTATRPYQGLSVDFSFAGTRSKNIDRNADFTGLNGETCWILITDHFTRMQHGSTRVSKASPITWLKSFLSRHSPHCDDKYIFMDQGGELFHNPDVIQLFEHFEYTIRPTGADASNQNGPVERAHQHIGNSIRAMLIGAGLPLKFWPYAFHHLIRIKNSTPSRDQAASPYMMATGDRDDFTHFRTFGCRVWVRPPGGRTMKMQSNSRKGIFLGFIPKTTKNILWYDCETNRVKLARHAKFDEGMNDLPLPTIPPNVVHLQRTQDGLPFPTEPESTSIPEQLFHDSPFHYTIDKTVIVRCSHPTFGFLLDTDTLNNRTFISKIVPNSSASKLHSTPKATNNAIRGAYILSINDTLVFTTADADSIFASLHKSNAKTFAITFAPERRLIGRTKRIAQKEHDIFDPDSIDDTTPHSPTFTTADLRTIAAHLHPNQSFSTDDIDSEEIDIVINAITSSSITPEEQALGSLTRRKLMKLSTWPEWRKGEHQQLDQFHALKMYGEPTTRPPNAIVLRPHWRYSMKRDGERRARNCCDGSKRSAPLLHGIASTYSSCVEKTNSTHVPRACGFP